MSFGLSPSDIVQGIQLARYIHETFFTDVNRADAKYIEFGDDVRFLGEKLTDLGESFKRASKERQRRVAFAAGQAARDVIVERDRQELVGDFNKTLKECHNFLIENSQLRNRSAGVLDNVQWHLGGAQSKVTVLRGRIQSHSTKILLIIKPLEVSLLTDVARDVRIIRHQVRRLGMGAPLEGGGLGLPPVPHELSYRYMEALKIDTPKSFLDLATFPLKEGFDALLFYFGQSTVEFSGYGSGHPTVEQYNNLIKSRWILEKLMDSSALRDAGPGSLWGRALEEIHEQIIDQYDRFNFDIGETQRANISRLDNDYFLIWKADEVEVPRLITDEETGKEEKILEVPLIEPQGASQRTLMVFRQSETELRLVVVTIAEGDNFPPQPYEKNINTHSFRFVPYYAHPAAAGSPSILLCNSPVHRGDLYDMKQLEDAHRLQRALTNYKVVYDVPRLHLTFHKQSWGKKEESVRGRIQFWQYKPLSPVNPQPQSPDPQSPISPTHSQDRSSISQAMTAYASQYNRSITSIIRDPNSNQETIAASRPRVPVMMLYTKLKDNLTLLHLELTEAMEINSRRCNCGNSTQPCLRVVLESKSPKKFSMRKHYAEKFGGNDILATWDLSLFGIPRHPKYKSLESIENILWLILDFPTMEEKDGFILAFNNISRLRNLDMKDYHDLKTSMERRANKPNARPLSTSPMTSSYAASRASMATIQPVNNLPGQDISPPPSISSMLVSQYAEIDRQTTMSDPAELSSIRPLAELAAYELAIGRG